MNRTKLKNYAPQARRDFIQAMTDRAAFYGLKELDGKFIIEPVVEKGDVAVIAGREHPVAVAGKRRLLEDRIKRYGFGPTMEALAYTWFNRLVAVRFMELHGYLDHGYRVLSHPEGKPTPEIVEHAEHLELPKPLHEQVINLKLAGNKEAELYRLLLLWQCNALHTAMPFLFERIDDETELLLPDNLLHSDSLIRKLVNEIAEEDWKEVEIIGWLYQFYISEKKDEVMGSVVASEDIPAATQLFTPNWIVKYLVQNTIGRQWVATVPTSPLLKKPTGEQDTHYFMEYYVEPAEQTPEVQAQLKAITPTSLNPEELTMLDPACGSGHILVEGYDLFKAIYAERGYKKQEIPRLILEKNLFGLEIDDRAAQLAAFALMMKAFKDDRRNFERGVKPNVLSIQESDPDFDVDTLPDEFAPHLKAIEKIVALFRNAKTFGTLIQVPADVAAKIEELEALLRECLKQGSLVSNVSARHILELLRQLRMLAREYDAVVANPPYMGTKGMNNLVKDFLKSEYPDGKSDVGVAFIERAAAFACAGGNLGLITMQSWMFLSGYDVFREKLLLSRTVDSMAHLGPRAFSSISGEVVQVTAFSLRKYSIPAYRPSFFRLTSGDDVAKQQGLLNRQNRFCNGTQTDFASVPGRPLAYWASENTLRCFQRFPLLETLARPRSGMTTGSNATFLRLWHEASFNAITLDAESESDAVKKGGKWFPYNKGGTYRKWFGNNDYVVNWEHSGKDILATGRAYPRSRSLYFSEGATWTDVTSSGFAARYFGKGFLFDASGPSVFATEINSLLAFLCSAVANHLLNFLNPTHHYQAGDVGCLPVAAQGDEGLATSAIKIAQEAVQLAQSDWNDSETSWQFQCLSTVSERAGTLQQSKLAADAVRLARFARMKELEEENNRLFIEAYGLRDELSPQVPDDQITLCRADSAEDIKRLLSYAIGCMMGRYSLDKPGLVYAHSGNQGFDPDQYKTFRADDDGIIPLLETDWGIRDDATSRFVEFIGVAWPKEHLEENLKFVADSLGTTTGEQPRDTIRRYLATGFYKHHLSMYKKRPIYWLFSSGKLRAFQCLVYLHRYNEGTLARMRTEYVIPLQGQIASRLEQLEGDIAKATSTSHRKKLQKQRDDLKKQEKELSTFEEKLTHAANQKIALDLDDGVKVNYGKFGDLLAESKAICGAKEEE